MVFKSDENAKAQILNLTSGLAFIRSALQPSDKKDELYRHLMYKNHHIIDYAQIEMFWIKFACKPHLLKIEYNITCSNPKQLNLFIICNVMIIERQIHVLDVQTIQSFFL